ncbi:transporter substrate-binding domain-containing protein [Wohlfahrtiimonas chitiniclastica]|uniref:transporter substrate-binding domain-containing protein n=1 Tax=Wohlfahrtiimonas chitiniclastica TaxID=400946 RepID=UPI001BCFE498|nr:transporter substrate-binding domain-containing protein [Wohlfahrtiimonas chitiniclastica]MBS7815462.1 transporter substrate-binding domain-containing protein [Wohlfahrtiimonas chitiniclastica]
MIKKLLLGLALTSSLALANEPIKIGIEGSYPPFSYMNPDRSLGGFEPDLANLFCEKAKLKCEIVQVEFDALIPSLNTKKIDAILASMSITDQRKQAINFTNKYYQTPAKFVAPIGEYKEMTDDVLKGKSIGVQSGTIHETYANEKFAKLADVRSYRNLDEAIFDLDSGRIDLVFADSVPLDDGYLRKGYDKSLEFVGPDYNDPEVFGDGIGIGLRKGDDALMEKFNEAILESRKDGSYQKVADQYFSIDVYGAE